MKDSSSKIDAAFLIAVWIQNLVRLGAVALIGFGVWMSYALLGSLWTSFHDSREIKALSLRIEKESGLNLALNELLYEVRVDAVHVMGKRQAFPSSQPSHHRQTRPVRTKPIDFSYQSAWLLFLLIVFAGVRIALAFIHKGARILLDASVPSETLQKLMEELLKNLKERR